MEALWLHKGSLCAPELPEITLSVAHVCAPDLSLQDADVCIRFPHPNSQPRDSAVNWQQEHNCTVTCCVNQQTETPANSLRLVFDLLMNESCPPGCQEVGVLCDIWLKWKYTIYWFMSSSSDGLLLSCFFLHVSLCCTIQHSAPVQSFMSLSTSMKTTNFYLIF